MLLTDLVTASEAVSATRSRRRKVAVLAETLRALAPVEAEVGTAYLAGAPRQERLDVGWRTLAPIRPAPADRPRLSVLDVHAALDELASATGAGSRRAKADILARLLSAATAGEQRFLVRLILGELRQGALDGVVAQGIAAAWDVPDAAVRRAWMLAGDLGSVAAAVLAGGEEALAEFRLTLFRPLQPMLAQSAPGAAEALAALGPAIVDHKLDGARIQVHRSGDDVRVYTRTLRDVTARSREVVAAVAALDVAAAVLDGEVIALRADGTPHPFQETMGRFGRDDATGPVALTPFFFDCLHRDGVDLLDRPLVERRAALHEVVPARHLVGGATVTTPQEAAAVYDAALDGGHEGVVVKALDSAYEAGRRGAGWRKVKPSHTFDLVVLAVEWGSGRRRGWLSNLHLGARDPGGGFVMLGKTFKGMTDEMLAWQTERLLALETARDGHVVHVRPELVVEVAVDGIQASTRYPGGVALRFARVKRYREDKHPGEADTVDDVRALRGENTR